MNQEHAVLSAKEIVIDCPLLANRRETALALRVGEEFLVDHVEESGIMSDIVWEERFQTGD